MAENKKNEKKGLFKRLFSGGTKEPCCCAIQLEEAPEEQQGTKGKPAEEKKSKGSETA